MRNMLCSGGRKGRWLIVLGLLLMCPAVMLLRMDSLAQYIAPSAIEPVYTDADEERPESLLMRQLKNWRGQKGELGADAAAGMSAAIYGSYVESAGTDGATATIMCVDAGWFDAHPRFLKDGYLFPEADYDSGAHKAVLDEELAFRLFPTDAACGKRVKLDGVWYDVIGVVRRADSPGDTDDYRMYIPLYTVAADGLQADYVQIDCRTDVSGVKRALEDIAGDVLGAGSFWDTGKEVMRALMLPRLMFIVFALYLTAGLLRAWNRRTTALVRGWFEEVKRRYFRDMLPGVIARVALQLAGYGALALAAWGILRLIIGPMYVFTEWVPEVIVEWSSISQRLTGLLRDNAAVVSYRTREYAAIKLYGALVRWGVICLMAGTVLYKVWPERRKK